MSGDEDTSTDEGTATEEDTSTDEGTSEVRAEADGGEEAQFEEDLDADQGQSDGLDPPADPLDICCLLYTSPSPRDQRGSRMPSSA